MTTNKEITDYEVKQVHNIVFKEFRKDLLYEMQTCKTSFRESLFNDNIFKLENIDGMIFDLTILQSYYFFLRKRRQFFKVLIEKILRGDSFESIFDYMDFHASGVQIMKAFFLILDYEFYGVFNKATIIRRVVRDSNDTIPYNNFKTVESMSVRDYTIIVSSLKRRCHEALNLTRQRTVAK